MAANLKGRGESLYESCEDISKMEEFDSTDFKAQVSQLMKKIEKYKQENYSLQCKLEVSVTMQEELREANDALEQIVNQTEATVVKKLHEQEEKFVEEKKDLFARLAEMETDVAKKTEEADDLRLKAKELNQKLQSRRSSPLIIQQDESELKEQIAELAAQLLQKDHDIKQINEEWKTEVSELREILNDTKHELVEKNEQLEIAKDDIIGLKVELSEVKEKPESHTSKGNSLFAEVEDRRKKMQEQMAAMKTGYYEAKRAVKIKEAENRALRAEKAALLRKWEDYSDETQCDDARLIAKYKNRIDELELKMQEQQEQHKQDLLEAQVKSDDKYFNWFQTTMNQKKQEIEELKMQLDNVSINAVLEEERRHKLGRQLRHWHWKAMSHSAQLEAIKAHLETNSESTKDDILKILQQPAGKKVEFEDPDEKVEQPQVVNESVLTLEKLIIKMPKSSEPETYKSPFDSIRDDSNTSTMISDDSSVLVTPKIPVASREPQPQIKFNEKKEATDVTGAEGSSKKTEHHDSNKENKTTQNVATLKSALSHGNATVSVAAEPKKEKKTLKFTDDTVDPPPRVLKRQATPKYPIVMARVPQKK